MTGGLVVEEKAITSSKKDLFSSLCSLIDKEEITSGEEEIFFFSSFFGYLPTLPAPTSPARTMSTAGGRRRAALSSLSR